MTTVNQIDIDTLKQTIAAVKEDPELGRCEFRATNRWLGGNRNATKVETFRAAGQEMAHEQTFELRADEPPLLAGDDTAPNPVEHLLAALASCVTTSIIAHAAVRGIEIEALESKVEGEIDLNGYMGLDDEAPRGYQRIRIEFTVDSDADETTLKRLAEYSPVYNTLTQGTKVDLQIEKSSRRGTESFEEARPS